eukprot:scaffold40531_cov53-Prasinocladus_malaysianus.AAC.1
MMLAGASTARLARYELWHPGTTPGLPEQHRSIPSSSAVTAHRRSNRATNVFRSASHGSVEA